jgi:hypothetical protein
MVAKYVLQTAQETHFFALLVRVVGSGVTGFACVINGH